MEGSGLSRLNHPESHDVMPSLCDLEHFLTLRCPLTERIVWECSTPNCWLQNGWQLRISQGQVVFISRALHNKFLCYKYVTTMPAARSARCCDVGGWALAMPQLFVDDMAHYCTDTIHHHPTAAKKRSDTSGGQLRLRVPWSIQWDLDGPWWTSVFNIRSWWSLVIYFESMSPHIPDRRGRGSSLLISTIHSHSEWR